MALAGVGVVVVHSQGVRDWFLLLRGWWPVLWGWGAPCPVGNNYKCDVSRVVGEWVMVWLVWVCWGCVLGVLLWVGVVVGSVCVLVGNGELVGRCGLVLVGLVVLGLGIGVSGVWGRSLLGHRGLQV